MLTAEGHHELVANHLDHLLGGGEGPHDLVGRGPLADPGQEVVDHLEGDVGVQQGRADVVQGRVHLFRVELASGPEAPKDAVQASLEGVEHLRLSWWGVRMLPVNGHCTGRPPEGR